MPVTCQLEEDRRLLFWRVTDPWSASDLAAHHKDVVCILNSSEHTIHSLIDIRGVHQIAPGILNPAYLSSWNHPRHGYVLVFGATPMIQNVAIAAFKIARFERGNFLASEADARAFLTSLPAN